MGRETLSVRRFLVSCFSVLRERGLFFALINLVYFGAVIVGGFLAQYTSLFLPVPAESGVLGVSSVSVWFVVDIFVWNFILSAFLLLTLSGIVFFVLPLIMLVYRGLLWGVMLNFLSTDRFFAVLPTIFLEGEGYVIAAVAGVVLGLSWLSPKLVYSGQELARKDALKKAWSEAKRFLVLVVILLFAAAVVEAVTVALLLG